MHGIGLTVLLSASSRRPDRNGTPLVETYYNRDGLRNWHTCRVNRPSAVNITIIPDQAAARARYRHQVLPQRNPDAPPADYLPTYYNEVDWDLVSNVPVLDTGREWVYKFTNPYFHHSMWVRLVDCDRGPDGTGRSRYAVQPYIRDPPWHLRVTVTALPPTPEHVLASGNLLLYNNNGIMIRNVALHGTPYTGLRVKFRRVTIDADGTAWEYDSSENLFACFNFDMRGALQRVEEAMEEEETDDEKEEDRDEEDDEGEDVDEEEEDEEGAGAAGGGEGEEDESSSESTPSVAETWHNA